MKIILATALALLPFAAQADIVSQVHNAPGWAPGAYTAKARVNAGPGWIGGVYIPGQPLAAYETVAACVEDATFGSGCTWKLLSTTDYISLTGWAFDNKPWAAGTYTFLSYVTADSPLRTYELLDNSCASTVAPSGTGVKGGFPEPWQAKYAITTSDGCKWAWEADVIYTSKKSYIPTQTYVFDGGPATMHQTDHHRAELWNDREYLAGQNGELAPIRIQMHHDFRKEGGVILGCDSSPCFHRIITYAPGESFRDTLKPTDPLTGYDPTKGVAIRMTGVYEWPNDPSGLLVHDNYIDLIGLQIKSHHGAAVGAMDAYGNFTTIRDSILEGGSTDQEVRGAAVTLDVTSIVANSLVISRGRLGVLYKYPGLLINSTIINDANVPGSIAVETGSKWDFADTKVMNTAIFGFSHAVAHQWETMLWVNSSNNVTDAPVGDSGTVVLPGPINLTVDTLPGTTYGASAAAAFMAPGDYRPKGPLLGTGAAYGSFGWYCSIAGGPNCAQKVTYNFDTPDILGGARPGAGGYDIGAFQTASGTPPPPPPLPPVVNGICGSAHHAVATVKPTTGLCRIGTASLVVAGAPWIWDCIGSNGGTTDQCESATVVVLPPPPPPSTKTNGACGPANGVGSVVAPTSDRCSTGIVGAATFVGSGPWIWPCTGVGGGTTASCTAPRLPTPPPGTNFCPSGCTAR